MKKLLLNCDQVFDVLTRGPFPTGSPDDEGVEHHLRACHECRQLAEALRPAVALLHEAVAEGEARDLPEYQGSLPPVVQLRRAPAKVRPANGVHSAGKVHSAGNVGQADRFAQSVNVLRLLAASVLVAALSLLVYGFTLSARNDGSVPRVQGGITRTSPADLRADPRDGLPDEQGLIRLVSLRLPAKCFPERYRLATESDQAELAAALASGSLEALRCCTECHHAVASQPRREHVAAVTSESCRACHRG